MTFTKGQMPWNKGKNSCITNNYQVTYTHVHKEIQQEKAL